MLRESLQEAIQHAQNGEGKSHWRAGCIPKSLQREGLVGLQPLS